MSSRNSQSTDAGVVADATESNGGGPNSPNRRRLLSAVAAGAGVLAVGAGPYTRAIATSKEPAGESDVHGKVRTVAFNDRGQRTGVREVERVTKSRAEWKEQLSPLAYKVTRQRGTERPFSGDHTQPDQHGIYRCIGCNTALYDSATQFHSGTGWPSFYQPIAEENVVERSDTSLGHRRTEIVCKRCRSHLGHVFQDGPKPTGLRYCMNAVALHFVPITTA